MGILEIMVIITGIALGLIILVLIADGIEALAWEMSNRYYDKHHNFDTVWYRIQRIFEPFDIL